MTFIQDYCNLNLATFTKVFQKGKTIYGKDSENLTFSLHAWFKISPYKREDFLQVAFELQSMEYFSKNKALFSRHVEKRWLTEVFREMGSVKGIFSWVSPKTKRFEKSAANNKRYKQI